MYLFNSIFSSKIYKPINHFLNSKNPEVEEEKNPNPKEILYKFFKFLGKKRKK
jgi:hypothetical protein